MPLTSLPASQPFTTPVAPSLDRDQAWVARVRRGDHAAFRELFHAFYPNLCVFACRYVHSETVAQDLVQDVLRRLWDRHEQWTVQATVDAYLYKATRNRVLDYLKHQRVEERWEGQVLRLQETGDGPRPIAPDEELQVAELAAAVERVADDLPARCRQVFLLKWKDNLAYGEIADVLGISVKTVEMQMTRAYKTLRERLNAFLP